MAFDGNLTDKSHREPPCSPAPLSAQEKVMLFDLAMDSVRTRSGAGNEMETSAAMIAAFARAYVLIRDREQGIV